MLLYQVWCNENNKKVASKWLLHCVFEEMNLSFSQPKRDQCDICCAHETGNISEEAFEAHILKKDLARAEKAMDKETALVDGKPVVLTIDLQSILLTPAILASPVYYKTKLCCHNFTVHDMTSKNVCCYFWQESEGGLQSTSFASCLVDYLENELNNNDVNTIIIFSDGCGYQNRNITMSNALTFNCKTTGKTVVQK